jgi:hypothetical protein
VDFYHSGEFEVEQEGLLQCLNSFQALLEAKGAPADSG